MTSRRGRGREPLRTRARGQRKERRVTPAVNVYDFPVDLVAPEPAPVEESPEDDTPSDPTRDEDFDEGEVDPYLDRFLADSEPAATGRTRRAHLAIADLNGELVVLVQGVARPLSRHLWPGLMDKARTLKAIGRAIIDHYGDGLRSPNPLGDPSTPVLRQAEIVGALGGDQVSTWKTRVSKIVRDEALELPDGRVLPLAHFIARGAGRPAAPEEWEAALTLMAEHPEWTLSDLAVEMVTRMADRRLTDPNLQARARLRERYRRRLRYVRSELRAALAARADGSDAELARAFVATRALPARLESVVARMLSIMRPLG